jgi:hypothetical protein
LRIQWAVPCREIVLSESEPGIADLRGAGIDTIMVPSLPYQVGVIVAARFATPERDAGSTVVFEAHLLGPGMLVLESIHSPITVGDPNPSHSEGWEMTSLMPLVVQFTAQAEGAHGLEIRLDNKLAANATTWFTIRIQAPAG